MALFVIQSKQCGDCEIPAQSYGYTAIEAIEYANWLYRDTVHSFILSQGLSFDDTLLRDNCVPVGSVEYVLSWLGLKGVTNVPPLNIPPELWHFCKRKSKSTATRTHADTGCLKA